MMAIAGCAGLHQAFYRESSDFWIGAVHRKMCSDPPGAKLSQIAVIVRLAYRKHFEVRENADFKLLIFCTEPAIRDYPANLVTESDLGPRIAHALLPIPGKRASDFAYGWIPVVGPIIGALVYASHFRDCTSAPLIQSFSQKHLMKCCVDVMISRRSDH
jgi:hypothetical protein